MPNQHVPALDVAAAQSAPEPCTITPALLKQHSITADEYARIEKALGRVPSLTELGIFSVMWSEHCSYKSSRVHLKRLPTKGTRTSGPGAVVQGPGENAGIIDVGDGWACAFKIESHNHPSYIEPYQGAATGVGGILRDIFTMGARPLAIMDSLRFGPLSPPEPSLPEMSSFAKGGGSASPEAPQPPDTTDYAKNHQVANGVVHGVAGYGNCFGVPNLGGETRFEPCYSGNPLLNAFALGLVRTDEIFYAKATGVGNPVFYVGAKTGRDGIHGATMASEEFTEGSEQKRPNVQMGDPFLEKLLLEACLEAMKTGAVLGIQDMGAAGLTCSTCEMGARGELGVSIELDLVPQRETGMNSYEIMLSESQERMLLVAQKGREQEVLDVFSKWGLDCAEVGIVTADDIMRVRHHGELVAEIPNKALTDDAPVYNRPVGVWQAPVPKDPPAWVLEELRKPRDYTADLLKLLASPNICDKRYIYEQYDSMVQTNTVQGPGCEAGVIRIKGTGGPPIPPRDTSSRPEAPRSGDGVERPLYSSTAATEARTQDAGTEPTELDPIAVDHSILNKLAHLIAGSTPKGEATLQTGNEDATNPVLFPDETHESGTSLTSTSSSAASEDQLSAEPTASEPRPSDALRDLDPTAVEVSISGKLANLIAGSSPEGEATLRTGNQDAANPVVAPGATHDSGEITTPQSIEAPPLSSHPAPKPERGLAMALAGNGRWCYLDPKLGAMHAVAEAARKVACTGATPVAATNCLNFGNPEKPEIMAQLSQAIDGIAEACTALGTPITGGNVSLYNETRGEGIYPTPVIGVVGILDDVTKAVPNSFQRIGDHILVALFNQQTDDWRREFGSSEFIRTIGGELFGVPPLVDLQAAAYCNTLLQDLAQEGLVHSMTDIGSGGIAVTLAKAAIAGNIGIDAGLWSDGGDESATEALFGERVGSVIITCSPANAETVIKRIERDSFKYVALPIGKTQADTFSLQWERAPVISQAVADLRSAFSNTLESQLAAEVVTA